LELETANTGISALGISEDSEVTFFSPAATPGVLEEPVVFTTVSTISDNEDTVVEGGSAEVLDDSTEVELESEASGINGNGDWSLSNGGLKGRGALGLDINEGFDLGDTSFSVASSVSSGVSIISFGIDGSSFSIFEGIVHKTTIATLVSEGAGAVNELLLRE